MKQYKVVVVSDGLIGGRFNSQRLQLAINKETPSGWKLVEAVTNTITPLVAANRDELLLFFEREFVDQPVPEEVDEWKCPECKCNVIQGQKVCHNCSETIDW